MSLRVLPILALILAWAPAASASGFQLREQSPAEQGNAFAGASAGAQDISSMFWNPAILPLYAGTQVSLGASWVAVRMDPSDLVATRAPGFQPSAQPITGSTALPNAASQPVLPSLYVACSLNDQWALGLSVNVPFGLETSYPDGYPGRYYGLRTSLKTYDITPAVGYRINSQWTVGAAFVARRAEATISNAVDFGAIGNGMGIPGFIPGGADADATLSGSAWAYGYKLGATWQPAPALRFGLGYQARTNVDIKGTVNYSTIPAAFVGSVVNGGASATLNLPAVLSAGGIWTVSHDFSAQAEVAWTQWSVFKTLDVSFDSGQPDDVTNENWKDTMFYSLGGIWRLSPQWSLKAGVAYDRSPVDNADRTPRIPDADRTWISAGAGWAVSRTTTVDFGATKIFAPTVRIGLTSGNAPTDPNYYRGNLTGTYKVSVTVLALSVRQTF